jgi:hypothetical protein
MVSGGWTRPARSAMEIPHARGRVLTLAAAFDSM